MTEMFSIGECVISHIKNVNDASDRRYVDGEQNGPKMDQCRKPASALMTVEVEEPILT